MTGSGGVATRERGRFGPGIYVHYPFCRSRCGYCDFFVVLGDEAVREEFFSSLLAEIDLHVEEGLWASQTFQTVFLGGGTPSLLGEAQMHTLLARLRSRFRVADDAEITVECNPESLTPASMRAYRAAGATRLSLGVQSMAADELALLDRAHGVAEVRRRVAEIRDAGFATFNLDLIYGLPGSDRRSWEATLAALFELDPPHLSAYLLSLEPHVPLTRRLQREEAPALPEDDVAVAQYETLCEIAEATGLAQYEISNFARPGAESRHNQNYWLCGDYLGLGPSAHSHRDGWRWSNLRSLPGYRERVAAAVIPRPDDGERLDIRARAEEWIFLGLRRNEGIDWDVLGESGIDLAPLHARVDRLIREGWLERQAGRIRLSRQARFVSNTVFTELADAL
ncbi:MAG: radical SAM family heme chaperone HemW [Candidatus Eisenbacteria bacterium]|uniref:Heme chaperone HemW n=1 Tax=Eiseniibacteriota bacterium TaxID=2212470 RepID=A0A956RQF8_UNCEI|nr:radical SAM family heme chaperone HemW [Candidatus Eisenbacteria bacterium]